MAVSSTTSYYYNHFDYVAETFGKYKFRLKAHTERGIPDHSFSMDYVYTKCTASFFYSV